MVVVRKWNHRGFEVEITFLRRMFRDFYGMKISFQMILIWASFQMLGAVIKR